jgi:RimJ/RimL family protein N-acetyltransferase
MATTFHLEESRFDSGVLADRVGVLTLPPGTHQVPPAATAAARRDGFALVMLAAAHRVEWPGATHLGTTAEFAGVVGDLHALTPTTARFAIAPITSTGWGELEPLLEHAAPTRFHRDPRLDPAVVRRHKRLCLESRACSPDGYTVVAYDSAGSALGFQCSYVRDGSFVLYEMMIRPHPTRGLIAAEMLAANLQRLRRERPEVSRLTTTIYQDNRASIDFFTRLALSPTGREYHHYHLWP